MPKYEQMKRGWDIPLEAGPDEIADMVRGIMSSGVSVQGIEIKVTPGEGRQGEMVADMFVPKMGPPDGDVPEPDPENMWQVLQRVPLEERRLKKPRINIKSLAKIASLMLMASTDLEKEARVPVAWLVNPDLSTFLRWLGVRPKSDPVNFFALPLIRVPHVEHDRLVLMCARSRSMDPLKSEQGYVIVMEK